MIVYNPTEGTPFSGPIPSCPRHCFLMTRLGNPVPPMVNDVRDGVTRCCSDYDYDVIDASTRVTGRDFLVKIWKMIASAPLAVGVIHEDIPAKTQANIYYELGIAQALGKETVIVKSPDVKVPSDFIRTEYIQFGNDFEKRFKAYLLSIFEQADYYETLGDQLDRDPILAIDYYKRAYLINGDSTLKQKVLHLLKTAGLEKRATNSVEHIAASF